MKIILTGFGLIASLQLASAQVLYQEDWGTVSMAPNYSPVSVVGWSMTSNLGNETYNGGPCTDVGTSATLPGGCVQVWSNSGGLGLLSTTDTAGSGTYGDSAFTDIDPTLYPSLTFSVEAGNWYSGPLQCWFAVRVGGSWYVSTTKMSNLGPDGLDYLANQLVYDPAAANWNTLTVSGSGVTVGGAASAALSGPITGFGLVIQANNLQFNEIQISATVPPPTLVAAPINQTVYAGGGASFTVSASLSQGLTYYWQTNGVTLSSSSHYSGLNSATLTVLDATAADAVNYSVIVSNSGGFFDTKNTGAASLTVKPVPANDLFAETFQFVGPNTSQAESPSAIGWTSCTPDNPNRLLYENIDGEGALSSGEGWQQNWSSPIVDFFYTSTNSDTGFSGLPFTAISTAANPSIAFSVDVDPTSNWYDTPQNSTAYFAVQMNGGNWYVNAVPIPVVVNSSTIDLFTTYEQQFYSAASVWNNLTFTSTGATIGSPASADLTGNITGAGIVVFETYESEWDFQNFAITTDALSVTAPSIDHPPVSQTVYTGGGVSFQVHVLTGGTAPFSYLWQSNGVTVASIVSPSNLGVFTITNATLSDAATYSCIVSNSAGTDNSANYATATLTVTSTPPGMLYSETFPTPSVFNGYQPISSVGWRDNGNSTYLFGIYAGGGQTGTYYFYDGGAGYSEYYTSTALDTGFSGLPFPSISLAANPNLTLSATFGAYNSATTANFIVQMNGGNWYVSATGLPLTAAFQTYTQAFAPAAANWKNYDVNTMTVGAPAGADLSGSITGAGLYFNYPSGENAAFNYFSITSLTSYGSITPSALSGNSLTLNWTANANAGLQWSTNLTPPVVWTDVPGTVGQGSATITTTNSQMFFRLANP